MKRRYIPRIPRNVCGGGEVIYVDNDRGWVEGGEGDERDKQTEKKKNAKLKFTKSQRGYGFFFYPASQRNVESLVCVCSSLYIIIITFCVYYLVIYFHKNFNYILYSFPTPYPISPSPLATTATEVTNATCTVTAGTRNATMATPGTSTTLETRHSSLSSALYHIPPYPVI